MRIGIIAEGHGDQQVIEHNLKGLGIDGADVIYIRPSLQEDRTDKNKSNNQTIGTWQGIKNACLSGEDYDRFFFVADSRYVVVHLDTAEIEQNAPTLPVPTNPTTQTMPTNSVPL